MKNHGAQNTEASVQVLCGYVSKEIKRKKATNKRLSAFRSVFRRQSKFLEQFLKVVESGDGRNRLEIISGAIEDSLCLEDYRTDE